MNWKEIKTNNQNNGFIFNGEPIFRKFIEVLKFHEPGFAPVQDSTGWFHIDTFGNELYTERYTRVFGFYCNRASVTDLNNNTFHINEVGKLCYVQKYAWCGNFQEDVCSVRNFEGQYFHIDKKGQSLYKEKYKYVGDFKDNYAVVKSTDGTCKHIDKLGNDLNGKSFLDLGVYHKSYATAKDSTGWFHIDINGNSNYEQRYLMVEPFYNGFALVENFNNEKFIIDEKGKLIVKI